MIRLPEYYLTHTERQILTRHAARIATLVGPARTLIELGPAAATQTSLLVSALTPSAYLPVDVSGEFLGESAAALAMQFPQLPICPITTDFARPFSLPNALEGTLCLGYFPGATIGALTIPAAVDLLRNSAWLLGEQALVLIGTDGTRDPLQLLPAYDDPHSLNAQFNLNLLHLLIQELSATLPVEACRYVARWNETESRMEMHLEATRDLEFTLATEVFSMRQGQSILTQMGHKYTAREARIPLRAGGWSPVSEWTNTQNSFTLILAHN